MNINYIKLLIKSNQKEFNFLVLFILFFVFGQMFNYWARLYLKPIIVHKMNADVSSKIINFMWPQEKTRVYNNYILSGKFTLAIEKGCEGTEGIILIVAALLAFPMNIVSKLIGILIGATIIYIANLARIIVLYYSLKYKPDLFDFLHIYVGQTFIIFIGSLFFIIWIYNFIKIDEKT